LGKKKWGYSAFASILLLIVIGGFDDIFAESSRQETCEVIKVKINILKDAAYDVQDLEESVGAANEILKKACIRIDAEITKLTDNGPDEKLADGSPNPNNDGRITVEGGVSEDVVFWTGGYKEAKTIPGKHKGVKIWVVKDAINYLNAKGEARTIWGQSSPGFPVISLSAITTGEMLPRGTDLFGATMAHELVHKLGLKHPTSKDGDPKNDNPGNLMNTVKGGRDAFALAKGIDKITLSPKQIEDIKNSKHLRNEFKKVKTNTESGAFFPKENADTQYGAVYDSIEDQAEGFDPFFDVAMVYTVSELDIVDLDMTFATRGPPPPSGTVDRFSSILFDTDADPDTGFTVDGLPGGYEIEVSVELSGDDGLEDLVVTGFADPVFEPFPLKGVIVTLSGPELPPGGIDDSAPLYTGISFSIPKDFLGFSADQIPIDIVNWDFSDGSFIDSTSLVYDRTFFVDSPVITPDRGLYDSGGDLLYSLTGFTPDTDFDLLLDSLLVDGGTTDSDGNFDGLMVVPEVSDDIYFLTAREDSGLYAFNVINVGLAYADVVLTYDPLFGGAAAPPTFPPFIDPTQALGPPDFVADENLQSTTLGSGGLLEVVFVDNLLTNNGDSSSDLRIYEIGADVELTYVSIRPTAATAALLGPAFDTGVPGFPSTIGDGFYEIGFALGATVSIDIDSFFPAAGAFTYTFDAVQFIDDPTMTPTTHPATIGADIDAVAALSSIPP